MLIINHIKYISGQEVASYWYMAVKQYDFTKEPDVLHANVNAGNKHIFFLDLYIIFLDFLHIFFSGLFSYIFFLKLYFLIFNIIYI